MNPGLGTLGRLVALVHQRMAERIPKMTPAKSDIRRQMAALVMEASVYWLDLKTSENTRQEAPRGKIRRKTTGSITFAWAVVDGDQDAARLEGIEVEEEVVALFESTRLWSPYAIWTGTVTRQFSPSGEHLLIEIPIAVSHTFSFEEQEP